MEADLQDYLAKIARTFTQRFDDVKTDLRGVREELRDVREELRAIRADVRDQSQRMGNISADYYEARRVRDIRVIGLEARMNEIERRLSELKDDGDTN